MLTRDDPSKYIYGLTLYELCSPYSAHQPRKERVAVATHDHMLITSTDLSIYI